MGGSAGFTLRKVGGLGMPGGSCRRAAAMADCTSCAAASMLRSSENWSVMLVEPRELVDVIESMPAMVENWRSSGVATEAAMVSGLAPGRLGVHLNGGEVHVGQVAHRQSAIASHAEQHDPQHDQRGHHRPANKDFRDVHSL